MPVVTLSSGGKVEIEINISARDYARLASFSDFQCRIDAIGSESFPLTIVRTSAVANASQLYSVRFAIQGHIDRRRLTPGMSAMVTANVAESGGTDVRIPSSARTRMGRPPCIYMIRRKAT